MQLLDRSQTSQANHCSKIYLSFSLTVIHYLYFKLLKSLGLFVVLGHKEKSTFCVRQTTSRQINGLSNTNTAIFATHRTSLNNKPSQQRISKTGTNTSMKIQTLNDAR